MRTQQPYLNPFLTVQELAEKVQIPAKDLSVLINSYMDNIFLISSTNTELRKQWKY